MNEFKLDKRTLSILCQNATDIYKNLKGFDGVHYLEPGEIVSKAHLQALIDYLNKRGYEIKKKE